MTLVYSDWLKMFIKFPHNKRSSTGFPSYTIIIFICQNILTIKNNLLHELHHDPEEVTVPMFADEMSFVWLARTENALILLAERSIDRVSTVHPVESSFILFSRTDTYYLCITGSNRSLDEIERKLCVKFLGVTFDDTMSLRSHVKNLSTILSKK